MIPHSYPAAPLDHPHVVAPPPVIYGSMLLIGFVLDLLKPAALFTGSIGIWFGIVLLGSGIALEVYCIKLFKKRGTTLRIERAATTIVTEGPFSISRNPIYIALTLISLGISLMVNSLWMIAMLIPALLIMHFGVVKREEAHLARLHGGIYTNYMSEVRRWL